MIYKHLRYTLRVLIRTVTLTVIIVVGNRIVFCNRNNKHTTKVPSHTSTPTKAIYISQTSVDFDIGEGTNNEAATHPTLKGTPGRPASNL